MKKIIGVIGITVFIMTVSFNSIEINNHNFNLKKLTSLNYANAECDNVPGEAEIDCPIWDNELQFTIPPSVICKTGGTYKCGFNF